MKSLKLLMRTASTNRFLVLVLVSMTLVCHVLSQGVEIEDKLNKPDRLVDQIYYNRYHSNNAKYLVWLLVLVPVFICIPCLVWVWCSDHCLQIIKYRNKMKVFKEKKLMNEIIMSNLNDNILNKNLSMTNQSLPPMGGMHPPPPPPPPHPPMHQQQSPPHFHSQIGGMIPPPYSSSTGTQPMPQSVLGGPQHNSIVPTHVHSSPAYIPNLYMSEPMNIELPSQLMQNDHIVRHHHHHCEFKPC